MTGLGMINLIKPLGRKWFLFLGGEEIGEGVAFGVGGGEAEKSKVED